MMMLSDFTIGVMVGGGAVIASCLIAGPIRDGIVGVWVGNTRWALRAPWSRAYFIERNGGMRVYPLGLGFRVTAQERTAP